MARKTNKTVIEEDKAEEVKAEEVKAEEESLNIEKPAEVINEEKPETVAANFNKPYKDSDGRFIQNGKVKYYLIHRTRKQIESNGIMIYEDDNTECGYFENLTEQEAKLRREMKQIF